MLVKAPKPGQDLRVDLPAIGPRTIAGSAAGAVGRRRRGGRRAARRPQGLLAPPTDRLGLFVVGARVTPPAPIDVAIVVGEHSGDQLGFKLMRAAAQRLGRTASASPASAARRWRAEGLDSLFPLDDIAVMGILPVLARLPDDLARACTRPSTPWWPPAPDVLVIIDSPDFTHAVARRVRRRLPELPDHRLCLAPASGRGGRAAPARMRAYVDHVLALLPFEPEAHRRLGGPPCTYVGHPLIERLDELRPDAGGSGAPGGRSRRSCWSCRAAAAPRSAGCSPLFGEALALLGAAGLAFEAVLPAVAHRRRDRAAVAPWPVPPRIVLGGTPEIRGLPRRPRGARRLRHGDAGAGAGRRPHGGGLPRLAVWKEQLKHLIKAPSIVLPNLILGENAVPELLQHHSAPDRLADALRRRCSAIPRPEGPSRTRSSRLDALMTLPDGETPSGRAAQVILDVVAARRR